MPSPQLLPYAATKAAIADMTASLAPLLGERDIRANSVAPGLVWTPLIPATMPAEKVESFGEQVPLGRPGQPAELARFTFCSPRMRPATSPAPASR
ncbi:NAD(P)-dependent dehydrogenase (short-subunit alcohol dehydrogenase family) [Microbacterium sp. 1154]|nr:NAD(P)-dependent dehydrogenase (short-subunit alcohol dehydrogenase family) [Microbacterium sp. 1154]